MFENFKVIANMRTPIATIDPIILDSIISAAKAKELLGEKFYTGENIAGEPEDIRKMLDTILDHQQGVYCTSIGIGDNREYVGSWSKRWNEHDEDIVKFRGRGKKRVDIGSGFYKNYHMPIVLKSYKQISFYVRGDKEKISKLLDNYIHYLGKKGSQGYGQIRKWEYEKVDKDYSLWKKNYPMRPIPVTECGEEVEKLMRKGELINTSKHPVIPPYWREEKELCIIPGEIK